MVERIKVVQVIPDLGVGGAERMMASLAIHLDRSRYDVKVVSLFDRCGSSVEDSLARDGIEIIGLGKKLGFDPRMFGRVAAAIARLDPDIVHTHRPVFPYLLPSVIRGLRARVVHTVHSVARNEVQGRLRRLTHWLAFRAGVTPVAICDLVARTVVDVYGVSPRATIPNGVPVAAFALPARCRAEWRAAHGIPADAVVFVSVARLSPPKDPVCVVDAFAAARDRGESVLLLAGDGALRGAVEARARHHGLERSIRVLGDRADIPEILAASDVFVLASSWEGHPLSVMEAMASALPVLATRVGGVPEIVTHGENGFLFPVGDVAALSRAMSELARDAERRGRLAANARRTAATTFDVSRMVAAYEHLYDELLAEAGRYARESYRY